MIEPDGIQQWYYGDIRGRNLGLNAVAGKPRELYNIDASSYDEMRPGCFNVDERVRDMNAGGQLAGLNFPNWTGFSGQVLNQGPDRDLNLIMIKAYNDWHIDEWCGAHPGRFIPCGILPLWDVEEAAKEIRRLADKGCHAVTFSENPEALKMPSIHTKHWYPMFKAASENNTVLCTHIGLFVAIDGVFLIRRSGQRGHVSLSSIMSAFTRARTHLGELLDRLPRPAVLAHRGGHRLDPLFPMALRARAQPSLGLDQAQVPARLSTARQTYSASTSTPASSATRSAHR